ncbi:hypothetical protein SDC9_59014 [bioreactor metagenome]|uniref:GmrSD restriction endonucleases N-terminal domain-containing protein n=1 Tax=bioreactor metagenome TaxID=1076179 RepID=A0A644X922_9ZZZZ|nr:DUF262 domain-containing protein [Rikenellaceae bacterium]
MNENELVLKSINQLMDYSFFIPSYQRGYRWTEKQVEELLEDIWAFAINPPKQEEGKMRPFYCLQPIVVKQKNGIADEWEVIDGQQRLTTVFLILKNLESQIRKKNIKRVFYETREESEKFLTEIKEDDAEKNIDFYHIAQANKAIQNWFDKKANATDEVNEYVTPEAKFAPTFLTDTKVIWYVINDGSDSYDIFTRLNIGKIQLTNSELIKALFLKKWNNAEAVDKLRLKQLQIATEWDRIENTLQDDSFWYFIYNKPESKNPKYANRIEYIFDLMKNKPDGEDEKYTFYKFYEDFEASKNKNKYKIPDTDALWLSVKKYFLTFEEWYKDRELYHLIGFLISTGYKIENILPEKENKETKFKSKTDFKTFLKDEIRQKVKFDISNLNYGDDKIKTVLLLFNIQTILSNEKSNMRFPFNLYKNEYWDIEHVRSQTDKNITGNDRKEWAKDMLEYFTGFAEESEQKQYIDTIENNGIEVFRTISKKEQSKNTLSELYHVAYDDKIDDARFSSVYNQVRIEFKEDNEPSKCAISNLALLDSATNRSYKNAFFPIKRKIILQNDKRGTFIPICTKNVFMKAYSKKFDEVMYWNKYDADFYLQAIEETLFDYLPKKQVSNDNE